MRREKIKLIVAYLKLAKQAHHASQNSHLPIARCSPANTSTFSQEFRIFKHFSFFLFPSPMSFLVAQLLFAYTWSPQHIPLGKALTRRLSNAVCCCSKPKSWKGKCHCFLHIAQGSCSGKSGDHSFSLINRILYQSSYFKAVQMLPKSLILTHLQLLLITKRCLVTSLCHPVPIFLSLKHWLFEAICIFWNSLQHSNVWYQIPLYFFNQMSSLWPFTAYILTEIITSWGANSTVFQYGDPVIYL